MNASLAVVDMQLLPLPIVILLKRLQMLVEARALRQHRNDTPGMWVRSADGAQRNPGLCDQNGNAVQ
jgi:hypothetical protein